MLLFSVRQHQFADSAKGFSKAQQEQIYRVGFREKVLDEKVKDLVEKIEKNEIKRLYFIGLLHDSYEYKEYFEKFFKIDDIKSIADKYPRWEYVL